MKLFYEYMVIFFNLSPTSSRLYPLQVENCDSNSRLVVDEDDNKFRLERVIYLNLQQLEVVSRYRDPQPHVVENYSYLFNLRSNIYKSLCLNSHFIPNNNRLIKLIN